MTRNFKHLKKLSNTETKTLNAPFTFHHEEMIHLTIYPEAS